MSENSAIFHQFIDLSNINDSMELDSGLEIARLDKGKYAVTLEVCGSVRVLYKDNIYRNASNMPEELIQMFHNWRPEYEEIVDCGMNNWFELFLWEKDKNEELYWLGVSDVCDAGKSDATTLRKVLEEYLDKAVQTHH